METSNEIEWVRGVSVREGEPETPRGQCVEGEATHWLNWNALCSLETCERDCENEHMGSIGLGDLAFFAFDASEEMAAIQATTPLLDGAFGNVELGCETQVRIAVAVTTNRQYGFVGVFVGSLRGFLLVCVARGFGTIGDGSHETAGRHDRFDARVAVAVLSFHSGGYLFAHFAESAKHVSVFDVLRLAGDIDVPSRIRANVTTARHHISEAAPALVPMAGLDPQSLPFRKSEMPLDSAHVRIVFLLPIPFGERTLFSQRMSFVALKQFLVCAAITAQIQSVAPRNGIMLAPCLPDFRGYRNAAVLSCDADAGKNLSDPFPRKAVALTDGVESLALRVQHTHLLFAFVIALWTSHLSGPRVFAFAAVEHGENRKPKNFCELRREIRTDRRVTALDLRHGVLPNADCIGNGLLRQIAGLACGAKVVSSHGA